MRKSYATNIGDTFELHSPEAQKLNELLEEMLTYDYVFDGAFERWYNYNSDKVSHLEYEYRQKHGIYE